VLSVALTGNVAAGKSAVASFWVAAGVPVVSADELARQAVLPGTPGLTEVRAAFGEVVMAPDGTLDRAALRGQVFADPEAMLRLEAILHPKIGGLRMAWREERMAEGAALVVAEIPLLFEKKLDSSFDVTVVVHAPEDVRLRRLMERRGLAGEEASQIMSAQMDAGEKRRRADIVIENDGSLEALERNATAVLQQLRERAGIEPMRLDLHLHTKGSWDCLSDPHAVLERALAEGLHRIAITDHNRVEVALRMAEEFPHLIIPGEEVKTAEGIDVVGLYLTEEIPKGTRAHETIDRIRQQGGIPYLPHPYAGGKGGGGKFAEELAARVDVVEVFNARLHPGRLNGPALELARRHSRLQGAGSDAHTVGELGGASVTVPRHANTPEALLEALRTGQVFGQTASNLVHLASTWAKIRKRLPGA
jgi:dephospho-CoA kinase